MNDLACVFLGSMDESYGTAVEAALAEEFGITIGPRRSLTLPGEAFDERRRQFNSEVILRSLRRATQHQQGRVLGIANVDLFIPVLSFVFGQAQLKGTVAVVSAARLKQEFYGFPPQNSLTEHRLVVEAVHEIGHTFGLTHCLERTCPMSLSTSLQYLDRKGRTLCPGCRILLRDRVGEHQSHS